MPPPPLLMTPRTRVPLSSWGRSARALESYMAVRSPTRAQEREHRAETPRKPEICPSMPLAPRLARTFSVGMDVWAKLFQYRTGMELPR